MLTHLINMRVSSIKREPMGSETGVMLSSLSCACQYPIHPFSPFSVMISRSRVGICMYAIQFSDTQSALIYCDQDMETLAYGTLGICKLDIL